VEDLPILNIFYVTYRKVRRRRRPRHEGPLLPLNFHGSDDSVESFPMSTTNRKGKLSKRENQILVVLFIGLGLFFSLLPADDKG
jgi:hypothetical protein